MIPRWIALASALALAAPTPAADLKLTVDFSGVRLDRPFPVTGGVPFARGALTDARMVRLAAADGRDVPLQAEVLARWPDRSVKWLLLDFQAQPGREEHFTLHYGPNVRAGPAAKGIEAAATKEAVTVDTGPLKLRIRSDGCGFLDELTYRDKRVFKAAGPSTGLGTGRRLNLMDAIHTDSPADYHPMDRCVRNAKLDPSKVVVTAVKLEKPGPLHAVVVIDGRYTYRLVGSTITGTDVKGDCPFRLRVHAYAGWSLLKVEHFFYYEGDGDHDFVRSLALKVPLPSGWEGGTIRYIGRDGVLPAAGPLAGLYQQSADCFELWNSDGRTVRVAGRGRRFEGVLDVTTGGVGLAVGVKDFWQNHAKSLHADLRGGEVGIYLWPPEACPLDFRRHAREWSVGETGEPDDKQADTPAPFRREHYRLASKGTGKTHYALVYLHDADEAAEQVRGVYRLFNRRPLLWAPPRHYAETLALGRYRHRVAGEHEEIEEALDAPLRFWRASQEHFRWYGFWLYGNVCQCLNEYMQIGRWEREFGRWGWANGDSMGRLGYALMLQAVRTARRDDLEFAEKFLHNIHDVCSIHTPSYPEHFRQFAYLKGTSHRHGAWPWACPYTGIRGSHPVGAKIHYFLTGEGHMKDVLEEITQLALKRPGGGMGDGPLGPNAQVFLYQWEATGEDQWRQRLQAEIVNSSLQKATGGWEVMMNAAFGIYNALEEYMLLTGDDSLKALAARFADEAMPEKMKRHWTRLGYYRVYAAAYNITRDEKYRKAIEEMLPLYVEAVRGSAAGRLPQRDWPGPAGGPQFFADGNAIRDIPFALYSLHLAEKAKEGQAK
jgi:hypothetical protein